MIRAATAWLLCAALAACAPLPPVATGVVEASRGEIPVGVVWWPAGEADVHGALGSEMEACVTARIREVAPEIAVTPQRAVRDALYPLLEPATQPATEAAFAALLAREDVRRRLATRGLRYLVAVAGGTREAELRGLVLCGAGYGGGGCLGYAWQDETTALQAVLWTLDGATVARREGATVEGTFVMPAFVLPIPIPARTQAEACRELGGRLAAAIREASGGWP